MIVPHFIEYIADGGKTEEENQAICGYAAGFLLGSIPLDAAYLEGPDDPLEGSADLWRGFFDARATLEWQQRKYPKNAERYEVPRIRLTGLPVILNAFVRFILLLDFQDDVDQMWLSPAERQSLVSDAATGDMWIEGVLAVRVADLIYDGRAPALHTNLTKAFEFSQWTPPDSPQQYERQVGRAITRELTRRRLAGIKPTEKEAQNESITTTD